MDGPRNPLRRRVLVATEPAQSLAVVGPTQSGKTSAVAVPAILGWDGPILAASVKADLVHDTINWRRRCGRVWCFDPAGTTGLPGAAWSPLARARTWAGARRAAADLTEAARSEGTTADGEFWYAMAAKLIAPLLFAAASAGLGMDEVIRWVDTQELDEVADALESAGNPQAVQAARATWLREERQRSSVYTTAEAVLEPFSVAASTKRTAVSPGADAAIDPSALLSGRHTLYVCAPAHDQRHLRALFSAVTSDVLHEAFARATRSGGRLDPPLLVVLDEAANIAPLPELDGLAATCAGHGVQLMTVWQDLAQVRARYGERAPTVVNNHRAKLFLPGIADPGTLDFASHLAGDEERLTPTVTYGHAGERSVAQSEIRRALLPPDALRRLRPGHGVVLYGSLPPVPVTLRPWWDAPDLVARAGGGADVDLVGTGSQPGARRLRRRPSPRTVVGRTGRR